MAAAEVTISGVLYDKTARTARPVVLIGEASLTGLGVGGGPIYPPVEPPGYHPEHPIVLPPHPEHPIVLPPERPPTEPPTEPPTSPVDPSWVWGFSFRYGWHPVYVTESGKPAPIPMPPKK